MTLYIRLCAWYSVSVMAEGCLSLATLSLATLAHTVILR